jgi:hypothetical protein
MAGQDEVRMEHIDDNLTQDTTHHPHPQEDVDDHHIFHSPNQRSQ